MKTVEVIYEYVLKERDAAQSFLTLIYQNSAIVDDALEHEKIRSFGKLEAFDDVLRYIKFVKAESLRRQEMEANEHYQNLLASDVSKLGKETMP